jgi:hypothetical protein
MTMICSIVYVMFDDPKAKKGLSGFERGVLIYGGSVHAGHCEAYS